MTLTITRLRQARTTPQADIDVAFTAIVAELTRRDFLGGLTASAALLGAAGCASNRRPTDNHPGSRTRDIATAYGTIKAPISPQRTVCVDTYTVAALLDVGYIPVGVGAGGAAQILAKYRGTYDAIKKVASADDQVDLEAIAALQPDLILGVDYSYISSLRKKLADIAPTAIFTWDSSGDWEKMVASASAAVDRSTAEGALASRYRSRTAAIRSQYAAVLKTARFDLVTAGGGQAYVWLPHSGVATVLTDAGVKLGAASTGTAVNAGRQDQAVGFKSLSYERLDALSDATAIITDAGANGRTDPDSAAMMRQPVFTRLPAAQSGNIAAFSNFFPFSYGQAIAALDELEPLLQRLQAGAGA